MIRNWIASKALNFGRLIGRMVGAELVVEVSEHSIDTSMEVPNKMKRAWDPDLYKRGQVYYSDYANPIKPTVTVEDDLADEDTVELEEAGEGDTDGPHVAVISSSRYRKYMRQDLISQLLTPKVWWRLITYAIIVLGALQFIGIIVTLWATGSF